MRTSSGKRIPLLASLRFLISIGRTGVQRSTFSLLLRCDGLTRALELEFHLGHPSARKHIINLLHDPLAHCMAAGYTRKDVSSPTTLPKLGHFAQALTPPSSNVTQHLGGNTGLAAAPI